MDRPAPPHSDALNRMVGITPPPAEVVPEADIVDPVEYEQRRIELRRKAAARSRARRMAAA
ncbi:hypothetical protein ACGFI9_37330 [Micromonospora sp. NPDC048930]|uniref:hypothetical protein n=1 Tax=Micromonospora sp. NPDC048930 TaxID=3364261 RepID=UPI00371817AF